MSGPWMIHALGNHRSCTLDTTVQLVLAVGELVGSVAGLERTDPTRRVTQRPDGRSEDDADWPGSRNCQCIQCERRSTLLSRNVSMIGR